MLWLCAAVGCALLVGVFVLVFALSALVGLPLCGPDIRLLTWCGVR